VIGVIALLTLLAFVLGSGCYVVGFGLLAIAKGLVDAAWEWAFWRVRR
jgi:hypothetical protein